MMETFPPPPTLTRTRLRSPQDARRVVRAVLEGKLNEYPCRLGRTPGARAAEAGDVYVYRLSGAGSVVRWTDSLGPWGSSRTRKGFLCYDSLSRRHICRKKLKVAIPLENGQEDEWQVVAYDLNDKAPHPDGPVFHTVDQLIDIESEVADGDQRTERATSVDGDTETVVTTSPVLVDADAFAMIAVASHGLPKETASSSVVLPPFSSLEPLAGPVRTETRARHHTLPFPSIPMLRSKLLLRPNGISSHFSLDLLSTVASRERLFPSKRGRSRSAPAILKSVSKIDSTSVATSAPPLPSRIPIDCEMIARFK
ncbi:hypothetical protein BKA62DRAFT_704546 [Auriculariales sp. MPI-PUGE-AT-0066]|nr:hypothetical protein BKA62DRAFT_704546 [Auriculariales sp. MPI-PUGE-AT-0066]